MRPISILAVLSVLAPTLAVAQEAPKRTWLPSVVRGEPWPQDIVAPGILRQDLFDRRNPSNLRHDYPAPPGLTVNR